jgi:predicted hotdog family 3-hydroxylacyl-ACP dehydratase
VNPLPAIGDLIPHAGRMCLLQRIVDWDAQQVTCATDSHRDPHNPLRHDGVLAAVHLIEYGAQAMAVHGGLLAAADGGRAAPGMLVAVRDVHLQVDRLDDLQAPLIVVARRLVAGTGGWLYAFHISAGDQALASGRVSVIPTSSAAA